MNTPIPLHKTLLIVLFASMLFCSSPGRAHAQDSDGDMIPDSEDNCPTAFNPYQADQDCDGRGDICDCKCTADFNCDGTLDDDVLVMLEEIGRNESNIPCTADDPCNGDFSCDGDVDADDLEQFSALLPLQEYGIVLIPDQLMVGSPDEQSIIRTSVDDNGIPVQDKEVIFQKSGDPDNVSELFPMAMLDASGEATVGIQGFLEGNGTARITVLTPAGDEITDALCVTRDPIDSNCATHDGTLLEISDNAPCITEMTVACEDSSGDPLQGYLIASMEPPSLVAAITAKTLTDESGEARALIELHREGTAYVSSTLVCGMTSPDLLISIVQCEVDSDCAFLDDQCNEGICLENTCIKDSGFKEGEPCSDGIDCTENDVCSGGICDGSGNDTLCDDANECTDDTCTNGIGCEYTNNRDPCDDGLFCNGSDTCSGGTCSLHTGNPCLEICNEDSDVCEVTTSTTSSVTSTTVPSTSTTAPATSTTSSSTTTTTITPPPPYSVSIVPDLLTLASLESFQFTAQTFNTVTATLIPAEECNYRWELVSPSVIGSTIEENGLFTAGLNETSTPITETVRVYDTAHADVSTIATATILVKYTSSPNLLPPGFLSTSYRMISVPFWPDDGDPLSMLTGGTNYNPYQIRLFRWDGNLNDGQGGYSEYPDIPRLEPGISIWGISLGSESMQIDGTPTDTRKEFSLVLSPGWNQIGNPFPFPVNWSQVSVVGNQDVVEPPWLFDGSYLPSTRLHPWQGYFVYNNSAQAVTILIPPHENLANNTVQTRRILSDTEEGFQLHIGVTTFPSVWLQDSYNFIGTAKDSIAERDARDLHEPPLISASQPSLYFSHQWEGREERYTTDFRSADSTSEVFECTISPGNRLFSLMNLNWSDTTGIPQEYNLELLDPTTGMRLDMRKAQFHWFFSLLGKDRHFTISLSKTTR